MHACFLQIKVYGYIHSTYGQASLDEMKRNVTTYYSWYAIDGIFVDEGKSPSKKNKKKEKKLKEKQNPYLISSSCH
jgi:hypothetical protein